MKESVSLCVCVCVRVCAYAGWGSYVYYIMPASFIGNQKKKKNSEASQMTSLNLS